MKLGIIYLVTNLINNKKYVGQTCTSLAYRKGKHFQNAFYFNHINQFYSALRRYGKENFEWKILEKDVDEINLDYREIYWIKFYDSLNNGYNMTEGGHSIRGYKHTQKSKDQIRDKKQGKSNLYYYIQRFGEVEGHIKYDQYINSMKDRKGKKRIDVLIDKYGEEQGQKIYDRMIEKISQMRKIRGATNKKGES
jgi:group I intron endonuclease